ncbi:MAG: hypothetical protein KGL39_13945 [Patescibacteria group bacterium]|nr:hypothetical protein [Patescibacteria group bacterium]
MRPRERREQERQTRVLGGDQRAILLASTPPESRSETAARYDHGIEAQELDTPREPTQQELDYYRIELYRASVAVALAENTVYRDSVMRYLGGYRTSLGMDREIAQAETSVEMPNESECRSAWQRGREMRRIYIRQRYGV